MAYGQPRPWLKKLALAALRQPDEIDFDIDALRIYPVRHGVSDNLALHHLPRYKVKSLTWLINLHQLVNSIAAHRDEKRRAEIALRARLQAAIDDLEAAYEANEVLYKQELARALGTTEAIERPADEVPDFAVELDDIPF